MPPPGKQILMNLSILFTMRTHFTQKELRGAKLYWISSSTPSCENLKGSLCVNICHLKLNAAHSVLQIAHKAWHKLLCLSCLYVFSRNSVRIASGVPGTKQLITRGQQMSAPDFLTDPTKDAAKTQWHFVESFIFIMFATVLYCQLRVSSQAGTLSLLQSHSSLTCNIKLWMLP